MLRKEGSPSLQGRIKNLHRAESAFSLLCLALSASGIRAAPQFSSYPSVQSPTLTSTSDNIYRSEGNLAQYSTQSKTVATPFSSTNKQFTSYHNPSVYATKIAYPSAIPAAVAPAPVAYSAAAPISYPAAPVVAPASYPAYAAAAPAPIAGESLLGVRYSPSVAVSHMTYSAPLFNYSF
ncbi:hypothetical protein QAD02_000580 [Eretmocerus hayati]|uniref:Uncharacterized protein n=1 Tax=Eretmocerus hayati TaxID=131215 RepID=A0ACC2NDZ7_9HYME|nr:hypothetical protein QAD02_000580 [Eretmocerus hayati]